MPITALPKTSRAYSPILPGSVIPPANTIGKTVSDKKKESNAFNLNGITPLEKNGAMTIMALSLTITSKKI